MSKRLKLEMRHAVWSPRRAFWVQVKGTVQGILHQLRDLVNIPFFWMGFKHLFGAVVVISEAPLKSSRIPLPPLSGGSKRNRRILRSP